MRQRPGSALDWKPLLPLCLLVFSGATVAQNDAPPGSAEQERILTLMRQYAAKYQRRPDVAFDQTLTSFRSRIGSDAWQEEFKTDQNRIAHDGREYLCCLRRKNGKVEGRYESGCPWRASILDGSMVPSRSYRFSVGREQGHRCMGSLGHSMGPPPGGF